MSAQRSRNEQLDLLGRVAVLTGASRGAGRAIATVLGEPGATVSSDRFRLGLRTYSWDDGLLKKDLHGRIGLALGRSRKVAEENLRGLPGDQSMSSHHAGMQKINPRVYQLVWNFE